MSHAKFWTALVGACLLAVGFWQGFDSLAYVACVGYATALGVYWVPNRGHS